MTILTTSDIAEGTAAGTRQQFPWNKATITSQTAGRWSSLWRATGFPAQGAIPSTLQTCSKTLTGTWNYNSPQSTNTLYLANVTMACGNSVSNVEIHDRLVHMGGLSGVVTAAQTVGLTLVDTANNLQTRIGKSDLSEVQWWCEWYTTTGTTAVTATVAVTYNDNSTGNISLSFAASMGASNMLPVVSAAAGKFIKSIDSVTLSATTGTAGSFGFTASRFITSIEMPVANFARNCTWVDLGLPIIVDGACLWQVILCSTTGTGSMQGNLRIIEG